MDRDLTDGAGAAAEDDVDYVLPSATYVVERVLNSRACPIGGATGGATVEYQVKWLRFAYIHCTWVKEPHMLGEKVAKKQMESYLQQHPLAMDRYLKRMFGTAGAHDPTSADNLELEAEGGFNPAFLEIDRIVARCVLPSLPREGGCEVCGLHDR
jgi:hypothetical protein